MNDPVRTLFDLSGQIVIVTGGASGLGFGMAEAAAEAGAHVTIADVDGQKGRDASAALANRGWQCDSIELDVSRGDDVRAFVADIVSRLGKLDVVFANAGVSAGPGPLGGREIADVSLAEWDRVLGVNLTGVFSTIQAASGPMKKQRSGRIIATASTAAFRGDGMVGYSYVASKAAVLNLVRQAAIELAPFNVLVNAIAPGPFLTSIGNGRMGEDATQRMFVGRLPLARIGHPTEIKGAALLLASKAGSFITGTSISVDGGSLAW
jgi:NAD(P)-dependent dehydrogenase (short-subunit alcohol dehydrogenase family)